MIEPYIETKEREGNNESSLVSFRYETHTIGALLRVKAGDASANKRFETAVVKEERRSASTMTYCLFLFERVTDSFIVPQRERNTHLLHEGP